MVSYQPSILGSKSSRFSGIPTAEVLFAYRLIWRIPIYIIYMHRDSYRNWSVCLGLAAVLALGWGGMCGKDSPNDHATGSSADSVVDSSARVFFLSNYSLMTSSGALMSVPVTGTDPVLLGTGVTAWNITPDKKKAFFLSGNGNLKSVPVAGGPAADLASGVFDGQITPDSSRLIYLTAGNGNLKSVPITGGASSSIAGSVGSFSVLPDSQGVIYATIVNVAAITGELYAAPITGGSNDLLSGDVLSYVKTNVDADQTNVIYSTPEMILRTVPITGGTPTDLVSGFDDWLLTPDRTKLIALTDYDPLVKGGSLRSLNTDGSGAIRISTYVYPGSWHITNDSARVVYLGNYNATTGFCNLKSVAVAGGGSVILDSQVLSLKLSPDTAMALYLNGSGQLRSVDIAGGTPVTITDTAPTMWQATSDNARVVFMDSFDSVSLTGQLKVAPMSGGSAIVLDTNVTSAWDIAPGDGYAIYITGDGRLKSAPLDGGTPIILAETVNSFMLAK